MQIYKPTNGIRNFLNNKKQNDYLKKLSNIVSKVEPLAVMIDMDNDSDLRNRIENIKLCFRNFSLQKNNSFIDAVDLKLLIEVLAIFKITSKRKIEKTPYNEQIMAGLSLFDGNIVEVNNGEGKTLAAVIPVFLEFLRGRQTHVITANEYLAARDTGIDWMGPLYHGLGLSVGTLQDNGGFISNSENSFFEIENAGSEMNKIYDCDVIYGKASDFAFGYLRDNMVMNHNHVKNTNKLQCAVIDEVDYVLLDQAREPCIISGNIEFQEEKFILARKISVSLKKDVDYITQKNNWKPEITEEGINKIENLLGIPNIYNPDLYPDKNLRGILHAIVKSLSAKELYKENVHYFIEDNNIVVIDSETGRPLYNNKYSDGLHQAIEIKHGLQLSSETQKVGEITYQNYFLKYEKISGMTGTAKFDEKEFNDVYGKKVVVIPSLFQSKRIEYNDLMYRSNNERLDMLISLVKEIHVTRQPILIGTLTIEMAEEVSAELKRSSINHELLDAKNFHREAMIIEKAGHAGSVTIAAKLAGRGTDIKLDVEAKSLGGLYVIGIERSESRRVDAQLKGRCARHGSKGTCIFLLSLHDDLMKLFGSERIENVMNKLNIQYGEAIEHKMITNSVHRAQQKVEANNLEVRKRLFDYDEIMDRHRTFIYSLRKNLIHEPPLLDSNELDTIVKNIVKRIINFTSDNKYLKAEKIDYILSEIEILFNKKIENPFKGNEKISSKELQNWIFDYYNSLLSKLENKDGEELILRILQFTLLNTIDEHWKNHLKNIDSLKLNYSLRSHYKNDFLTWYRTESVRIFDELLSGIEKESVKYFFKFSSQNNSKSEIKTLDEFQSE